jgi:hypothetical protein
MIPDTSKVPWRYDLESFMGNPLYIVRGIEGHIVALVGSEEDAELIVDKVNEDA